MQNNFFETQMEVKIEQFKLQPSEAVWVQIEAKLKQKRKRRFIFFFAIVSAALLTGALASYNYFTTDKKISVNKKALPHIITTKNKHTQIPAKAELVIDKLAHKLEKTVSPVLNKLAKNTAARPVNQVTNKFEKPIIASINNIHKTSNPITIAQETTPISAHEQIITHQGELIILTPNILPVPIAEIPNLNAFRNHISLPRVDKPAIIIITQKNNTDKKTDTVNPYKFQNTDTPLIVTNAPSSPASQTEANELLIKIKRNKIWLGLEFGLGSMQINEELFPQINLFGGNKDFALIDPNATQRNIYPQQPIHRGFSGKFGLSVKKPLNKRISLLSGLNLYAGKTTQKIGATQKNITVIFESNNSLFVETRGDVYLASADQRQVKDYTNRYYALQLPLSVLLKLNRAAKYGIELKAGVAAGYMFYTNAMQYDTLAGGINYLDKNLVNPMRWSSMLGINFSKTHKTGYSWSIGPEIVFDVNKFSKNYFNKYQYPVFVGINTRFYFKH